MYSRFIHLMHDKQYEQAVELADQGNQHALFVLGMMSPEALGSQGITSRHAGKRLRRRE